MNLYIDIGNSRIKWMSGEEGKAIAYGARNYHLSSLQQDLNEIWQQEWLHLAEPEAVFVSNVAGDDARQCLDTVCENHWRCIPNYAVVSESCLGVKNAYVDHQQLGVDRWLAIISAWNTYKENVLVVDSGTALTIDAVLRVSAEDKKTVIGVHQGGLIIPGIQMMRQLLVDKTQGIHSGESGRRGNISSFATSTEEGVSAGSIHALAAAIEKSYKKLQSQCHDKVYCVMTGGTCDMILSGLEIDTIRNPHLVLTGLALWSQLI